MQGIVTSAVGESGTVFVPISPCRLADTRGGTFRVGPNSTLGPADTRALQGRGATGKCNIPVNAAALSLNVTSVGATAPSFLTVWPDGARPDASSLNPSPGQPPTPNAVTTPLGADGFFRVFNAAGAVDVIVDVNGYYTEIGFDTSTNGLIVATVTGYDPAGSITSIIGVVSNGTAGEADVRVEVPCGDGTTATDLVFNLGAGQTLGWSVLCSGVITSGATARVTLI